jgi:transcription elongation factor Elf1
MAKKRVGERFPCPNCGGVGYNRSTKKTQTTTTHYMECRHCGCSYKAKETGGWLGDDIYYGPTPAMRRLMTLWVGNAVAESLGK